MSRRRISRIFRRLIDEFFDVVIIGGGITGCMTAFRLSEYDISVCLFDKAADLATGATGANSAIVHAGFDPMIGSLKAKYNVAGNLLFDDLCRDLGVPFVRNGSLVLSFDKQQHDSLLELEINGRANGVCGLAMLTREQALDIEPGISPFIYSALLAPSAGVVNPYELAFAAAETASRNGVKILTDCEVTSISRDDASNEFVLLAKIYRAVNDDSSNIVSDIDEKHIRTRLVVNAAGAFADKISAMAGDSSFTITPRRGEYAIIDKQGGVPVQRTIFQTPTEKGKGVLVTPAVDQNIIIGPNADLIDDPSDTSTTSFGTAQIWESALKSVPSLNRKYAIKNFAGIRATSSIHDFIVGRSISVKGLYQAAGIESPGLTAAPALSIDLANMIIEDLRAGGREAGVNPDAVMSREAPAEMRKLSPQEQSKLIARDPGYGRVVCRCESITEAEIRDAIRRIPGRVTLNGIKMRTRAGMGRCQGGFCLPRILKIIAEETGCREENITLSSVGSHILTGRTRP